MFSQNLYCCTGAVRLISLEIFMLRAKKLLNFVKTLLRNTRSKMHPPSNEQMVTHHSVSDMMIPEFNTPSKNLLYSDVQENDVAEDFSTLITEFTRC